MWDFVKKHWMGVASVACGVASTTLDGWVGLGVAGLCGALGLAQGQNYLLGRTIGSQLKKK